jgi:hypothetical protein
LIPDVTRNQVTIPPTIKNSPCAKLTIPANPKISVIPIPIRMVTLATERLLTNCWIKISKWLELYSAVDALADTDTDSVTAPPSIRLCHLAAGPAEVAQQCS